MQAVAASTPFFEGPAVSQEEGRCSVKDLTFTFLDNVGADCQLKIFFPLPAMELIFRTEDSKQLHHIWISGYQKYPTLDYSWWHEAMGLTPARRPAPKICLLVVSKYKLGHWGVLGTY